jgi:hypothetical protein
MKFRDTLMLPSFIWDYSWILSMSCSNQVMLKYSSITLIKLTIVHLKSASTCIIAQFKQINQLDATVSQIYYLTFMYSSTCFGRSHVYYQELNNCSSSLWFYR